MAALTPEQAAALKAKYATAEDFKASDAYKRMVSPVAQQMALAVYTTPTTPVTPTPVSTPTTPTTTPTGGRIVNGRIYDANGQYIGMEGSTPVSTPETTVQPSVSTPEINTPTTTTTVNKNEPSKTDTSTNRLTEIQTNLTQYAQTNPELFTDINKYKQFFGYNQRVPEQQAVLDSFFKTRTDNTNRLAALSIMSDSDLMNVNDINDISLINQDPNLQAKYQQAQKNKQMLEFVYGADYNKTPVPTIDGLDGLPDNIQVEIANASSELMTTKNEMDKIQDTMDSTYDNLVKQAEGTGATDAYIRAKANKINASLTNEYNDLVRKYNSQLGTVTGLNSMVQAQKEEDEAKRQERAQNLEMFNSMYGSFSDRNSTNATDPNITKTIEQKNAKGQTIGYLQWNPETNRYDIPVEGSMGGVGGGGGGGGYSAGNYAQSIQPGTQGMSKFYNPSLISTYTAFIEKQTKPTEKQINALGGFEIFAQDAYNAYIKNESARLGSNNITITDPSRYATKDATEKKMVQTDIRTISQTVSKLDNLMKTINEGGMPTSAGVLLNTGKQREYNQLLKDVQLALKNEGIYNLGVLNGPDLTVIEGALPNIDIKRLAEGKKQYLKYLTNMRNVYISQVNEGISSQGLKFTPPPLNLGGTSNNTPANILSNTYSQLGITTSNDGTTPQPTPQFGIGQIGFGIGGF